MLALAGGAQDLARRVAVEQPRGDREVVGHLVGGGAQAQVELRLLGLVHARIPPGACQESSGGGGTTATSASRAR